MSLRWHFGDSEIETQKINNFESILNDLLVYELDYDDVYEKKLAILKDLLYEWKGYSWI